MTTYVTLEQLEHQVTRLPIQDQLMLVLRIVERLTVIPLKEMPQAEDADELLALCDAAAEMWNGAFDAVHEIHQIRQQRDEQIWPTRS